MKGRAGIPGFWAAGAAAGVPACPGGRTGAAGAGRPGSMAVRAVADEVVAGPWILAPAVTGAFVATGFWGAPPGPAGDTEGLTVAGTVAAGEAGREAAGTLDPAPAVAGLEATVVEAAGFPAPVPAADPSAGLRAPAGKEARNRPATSSSTVLRLVFASTPKSRSRARTSGTLRFSSFASCPTRILAITQSSLRSPDPLPGASLPGARDSSRRSGEGPASSTPFGASDSSETGCASSYP